MINTLSSSVASWRGEKDIRQNSKACEILVYFRFQFPWLILCPKRLENCEGFFWPVILCNPRPNRKCFGVKTSQFLTPWIKPDAYDSINLTFFAKTVCLLCFNKFFIDKITDNGGILSSFNSSSIFGDQFNGGKILQWFLILLLNYLAAVVTIRSQSSFILNLSDKREAFIITSRISVFVYKTNVFSSQ